MKSTTKRLRNITELILKQEGFLIVGYRPGPLPMPKNGQRIDAAIGGGLVGGEISGPFYVRGYSNLEAFIKQAVRYARYDAEEARAMSTSIIAFYKLKPKRTIESGLA